MSAKRSTRFYRRNEADVMNRLGLKPTKSSGSGWVEKADGQNEHIICELKSTDKLSYRLSIADVHKLIQQSNVSRKLPVFAIQFLQSDEIFLVIRPGDIADVSKYIETGEVETREAVLQIDSSDEDVVIKTKGIIKSSSKARESIRDEINSKYERREKKAT